MSRPPGMGYRAPDWFWEEPDPWWVYLLKLIGTLMLIAAGIAVLLWL